MSRLPESWAETRRLGVVRIITELICDGKDLPHIFDYFLSQETRSGFQSDIKRLHYTVKDVQMRRMIESGIPGSVSVVRNYLRLMKGMGLVRYVPEQVKALPGSILLHSFEGIAKPCHRRGALDLIPLEQLFFMKLLLTRDSSLFLPVITAAEGSSFLWSQRDKRIYRDFCKSAVNMLEASVSTLEPREQHSTLKQIEYLRRCEMEVEEKDQVRSGLKHLMIPRLSWLFDLDMVDFSESIRTKELRLERKLRPFIVYSQEETPPVDVLLSTYSSMLPQDLDLKEEDNELIEFSLHMFSQYFARLVPYDQLSDLVYFLFLQSRRTLTKDEIHSMILSIPGVVSYRGMYGGIKFVEYHPAEK